MKLSEDLWTDHLGIAARCLEHDFVAGLGDGSLDPDRFRRYVAQDAYFLRTFARAYAVCAARAPDETTIRSFLDLSGGALDELNLHASYARTLGIDLSIVTPLDATLAYTDFLTKTAWHAGLPETIAAMTPCMRLYAWLGAELAKEGVSDHAYSDWIRTYSDPEFEKLAVVLEDLLDRHCEDTEAVRAAYTKAMELEYAFFDAFA
jgi:thiaminase/transcriptional activator TenA